MDEWLSPQWLDILVKIGLLIIIITIVYSIISYIATKTKKTIYITSLPTNSAFDDLAAYYYLPAPLVKITATAKVEIQNDEGGSFKDALLKELSFVATTETFPDTSQLLSLRYTSNSFANDDLKIAINNLGLLDNLSAVTEDRFSNIISALLAAPGDAFITKDNAGLVPETALVNEIKDYVKEFIIEPANVKNGGSNPFEWLIDVPDASASKKQIDASFKANFGSPFVAAGNTTQSQNISYTGDGVLVRPSVALTISFLPDKTNPLKTLVSNAASITVPDVSKAVLIPVTRASLVKKTQILKFQNGMLIENSIIKPSQSEAFISIPINILKAIFSIPSQLLSFRIHHIQQQKTLVTEDAALAKARLDSEKARIGTDAELSKAKLEAQKTLTSFEQDLLKAKLDTQKAVTDAEKARLTSETDLIKAKLDSEKNKQNSDAELAKAKLSAQKDLFTEQSNLLKAWHTLLEEMKKK